MSKNKHLILADRCVIEQGLINGLSFKAIGLNIEKNCTTISKEVRNHICFLKKGAPYRKFNDCINRRHCHYFGNLCDECTRKQKKTCSFCGKCTEHCPEYKKEECPHLKKPPYVCNGCHKRNECTLEKRIYNAKYAQQEYELVRSESRSGLNLTENEIAHLNSIVSPLLQNGQSIHHIMTNNPDLIPWCEKTIYKYVDNDILDARNIDLPRKVRFRPRKKKSIPVKVDKVCRIGRTFDDFKLYESEHPELPIVQLDSVEGVKGGAVLLTVHFVRQKFQLAFLRTANNSSSIIKIFNELYQRLGKDIYMKLFPILLADNGTEFSNPRALEYGPDGEPRSKVFYCNPSAPNEKGACEVNHEFIRRIIPKGKDIGRYSQEQINLMMNNINSYSRADLGNKTPYAMMEFYYGKTVLDKFHFTAIEPNDIVLKPSLLSCHN